MNFLQASLLTANRVPSLSLCSESTEGQENPGRYPPVNPFVAIAPREKPTPGTNVRPSVKLAGGEWSDLYEHERRRIGRVGLATGVRAHPALRIIQCGLGL